MIRPMTGKQIRHDEVHGRARAGVGLVAVRGDRGQLVTVVEPVQQPGGPEHQRGRAGAERGDEQRGGPVRQHPGGDALADPDVARAARSRRDRGRAGRPARRPRPGRRAAGSRPAPPADRPSIPAATDRWRHWPSPSGATAYMTTPNSRPVVGADGQRAPGHLGAPRGQEQDDAHVRGGHQQERDLARPGRTAGRPAGHPAAALGAAPALGDAEDVPVRGLRGVRLADASTMVRPGRRARIAAQHKTRRDRPGPAGAGRPEEPPGQQRQPGQQQHRGDHVEPADRRVADLRLRPGRPGRGRRGRREQQPRGRACAASAPPARSPRPRPPARPAARAPAAPRAPRPRSPRPSPAARPAAAAPRARLGRGRRPAQLAHGTTSHDRAADGMHRRPRASLRWPARAAPGRAGQCPRGAGQPGGRQPVQVPPRPARLRLVLPARLDQAPVGQPDQDRVQRARLQARLPGQRVPVLPLRRLARTAPPAPTASARRTRMMTSRRSLYIGRYCTST